MEKYQRFTFNRGSWEDGHDLPEPGQDDDPDGFLESLGYTLSVGSYGQDHGGSIRIFEEAEGNSYVADVCPFGGYCFEVFLPDFPSLMMFIKDYGTAFSAEATHAVQSEMLTILKRLFRAEHGHDSDTVCQQCDPDELAKRTAQRKAMGLR